MESDIMHELKISARRKIAGNMERVIEEMRLYLPRANNKRYMAERFRLITEGASYIPTTEATRFFRINDMNFISKILYGREFGNKSIDGCMFGKRIEFATAYFGEIWDKMELKNCRSLIYKPSTFVYIRKEIVGLLEVVGCSYWDYYEDYMIPRSYEYISPLTDLAILCDDISNVYCPCALTAATHSYYPGNDDRVYKIESLQIYATSIYKLLITMDEYMDKPKYKDFLKSDVYIPDIHEYARETRDLELLYDLDRMYASLVIMDIAQVCLSNRLGPKNRNETYQVVSCPLDRHTVLPDLDNTNRNVKDLLKDVGFICAESVDSILRRVKGVAI